MKAYKISFWLGVALSTLSVTAGFLYAGYGMIGLVLLPVLLVLIIFRDRSLFWIGTLFLLTVIFLAAIGIMVKALMILMIIASTAALASWDLYLFGHDIDNFTPERSKAVLIKDHLSLLGLVITSGLMLTVSSSFVEFKLPFGFTVLIVLLMMICLLLSMQMLKNNS